MIIVLCNSFEDVKKGFLRFIDFLEEFEPLSITKIFEHSYCVQIDVGIRYLFIDYRFKPLSKHFSDDISYMELDELLEGVDDYYWG